jgi:hypothetical protein
MVGHPASHIHASDLVSSVWGSYFFCQERKKVRNFTKDVILPLERYSISVYDINQLNQVSEQI